MTSLRPRKSPVQQRSAATVATLLEAAAQVLEVDGVAGFTTNAIARRAGVSVGTLYQYFPDKHAIVGALSRAGRAGLLSAVATAIEAGRDQPLDAALRLLVAAALKADLERPRFGRVLDLLEAHLPLGAETEAVYRGLNAHVATFLASRFNASQAVLPEAADALRAMTQVLADTMLAYGRLDGAAVTDKIVRVMMAVLPEMLEGASWRVAGHPDPG